MILILLVITAQALDLITFLVAAARLPIEGEANLFASFIYINAGLFGVVALKVAATSLVVAYVAWQGPWYVFAASFALVIGLAGALVNALALMHAVGA